MAGRKNNNHKLSVVVPLFREPHALENIQVIKDALENSFAHFEIICVEDGHETGPIKFNSKSNQVKILSYPFNVGKGFALSYGFSQSKGDLVAFLDGDLEIHPKQLRLFADLLDLVNADIVIGSKRHPLSQVKFPPLRRVYSRVFQLLVRFLFGLNVTDTQVGIKLFRRKVLKHVMPKLAVKRWAFDLELLVVAHHLGFRRIIEAPVELKMRSFGSKINIGSVRNVLQDTAAIFYRLNVLHHYDRNLAPSKIHRRKRAKKTSKK